jgi:hypothetical protein
VSTLPLPLSYLPFSVDAAKTLKANNGFDFNECFKLLSSIAAARMTAVLNALPTSVLPSTAADNKQPVKDNGHLTRDDGHLTRDDEQSIRDNDFMQQLHVFELHGSFFPAGIYTRGCHWIPRMFA